MRELGRDLVLIGELGGLVVEQQHDQAAHGRQLLEAVAARPPLAGACGEQAALAVVDRGVAGAGVRSAADAGTSCPVRLSMPASRSIPRW